MMYHYERKSLITDPRSSLMETKSSQNESNFPADMSLEKFKGLSNQQSPEIARKFCLYVT